MSTWKSTVSTALNGAQTPATGPGGDQRREAPIRGDQRAGGPAQPGHRGSGVGRSPAGAADPDRRPGAGSGAADGAPRPGPLPSAASLERFGAVRLFLNRARAVRPAFVVDGQNAGDVVAICRRLDGLPLAMSWRLLGSPSFLFNADLRGVRVQLVRSTTRLRCRRERLAVPVGANGSATAVVVMAARARPPCRTGSGPAGALTDTGGPQPCSSVRRRSGPPGCAPPG